jgi:YVTN family beta-propeller protein
VPNHEPGETPAPVTSKPSQVLILALGLGLMVSLAQAQWIEDSVNVDTTHYSHAHSLTYNPTADVVYGIGLYAFFAIDCATNQLIASVPLPRYGSCVAYDSADGKAYYSSQNDSVVVIDGTTHSRLRAIALDWPDFLVWDPDLDRLYACQPDNDRVAVIDCHTDSVLTRIHVGAYPIRLYLNRPQHKLYVLNQLGNSVSILDLNTLDVIETIPVDYPSAGWYAPAAGKFYCGTGAEVYVIDGVGDSLRKVIPLGTPNGVNEDGVGGSETRGLVLAGTGYDTVSVIDIARDSLIRRFHAGGGTPSSFLYSAASNRFYCGNRHSVRYNVALIAPDGSGVLRTLPVAAPVSLLAVPTHGRIYVGTGESQWVYVLRDSATGVCEPEERSELPVLTARPNPFRQTVTFYAPTSVTGPPRIWNAAGAFVRTLPGRSDSGDWIWDGRDAYGRRVVSGVYYATIDGAPGAALKVVRVP